MLVRKFGGSVLQNSSQIMSIVDVISNSKIPSVNVFSAFYGATDKLVKMANLAIQKNQQYLDILADLYYQHSSICQQINLSPEVFAAEWQGLKFLLLQIFSNEPVPSAKSQQVQSYVNNESEADIFQSLSAAKYPSGDCDNLKQSNSADFELLKQDIKIDLTENKSSLKESFISSSEVIMSNELENSALKCSGDMAAIAITAKQYKKDTDVHLDSKYKQDQSNNFSFRPSMSNENIDNNECKVHHEDGLFAMNNVGEFIATKNKSNYSYLSLNESDAQNHNCAQNTFLQTAESNIINQNNNTKDLIQSKNINSAIVPSAVDLLLLGLHSADYDEQNLQRGSVIKSEEVKKTNNNISNNLNCNDTEVVLQNAIDCSKNNACSVEMARKIDLIISIGEVIAVKIIHSKLCSLCDIEILDATACIRTDSNFGNAAIDISATKELIRMLSRKKSCIMAGFIGSDIMGNRTTIGRNGSDLTAVLMADLLGSGFVEIWKELDGIYTADPCVIEEATPLISLSFEEMLILAKHGNKAISVKAIDLSRQHNINILVRGLFSSHGLGTIISSESVDCSVKSISILRNVEFLAVELGLLGDKILPLSSTVHQLSDLVVAEMDIKKEQYCVVTNGSRENLQQNWLNLCGEIELLSLSNPPTISSQSLIAIVGNNIHKIDGIYEKMKELLHKCGIYDIMMLVNSPVSLFVLLRNEFADAALRALHRYFFSAKVD